MIILQSVRTKVAKPIVSCGAKTQVLRAEVRNFSSNVEKYFIGKRSERMKYFSSREEKLRISQGSCNGLLII